MLHRKVVSFRTVPAVLWALCALAACSDVPATNPFDPSTPAAQQARSSLEGRVTVPPGYTDAVFAGAEVELRLASAPAEVARTEPLTPEAGAGDTPAARFVVTDLTAGVYLVRIQLPGLGVPVQTVELLRGERADLGTLQATTAGGAFVEGAARLEGPGITSHAGILVTAPGTPAAALTTDEGLFRLEVAPGRHTLRATYAGYTADESAEVEVRPGETTALAEPLVLRGQPGAIAGRVRLLGGYAQERVAEATVVLQAADGAEVARAEPSPDGAFLLADVPAGAYRLSAAVVGFAAPPRDVVVPVGVAVDLGDVFLAPAEEGILEGTIRLEGATDHSGVVVSLAGSPATAISGPDGAFRAVVAAGNYTLRLTRRGYTHAPIPDVAVLANQVNRLGADYVMAGAPGSLEGTVGLPPGFDPAGRLFTTSVRVHREGAPEGEDAALGTPTAEGRFVFEALPAGPYRLTFHLEGFRDAQASVLVPLGERVSIGHVTLEPAASDSALVGRAELQGAQDHGGIAVEVDGQPYRTATTAEGRYRLEVPALAQGGYGLTFRKAGYGTEHRQVTPVPPGEIEVADTPILVGQTGRISGLVELDPRFEDPGLFPRIAVRLERLEDGARVLVDQTPPSADGVFVFDDLPADTYYLFAELEGFVQARGIVSIGVGEEATASPLYLSPDEQGQQATLTGRVLRAGRADGEHGGIRVEAALSGYVTLTGANGDFTLDVVAGTYTLLFSADGYAADEAGPFTLEALERQSLPEPVVLGARPGAVRGAVSVPEGFDALGRVERVSLVLTRPADGFEHAHISPQPDGTFLIPDVPPGPWRLSATLPGFSATPLLLDVAPGEVEDVHLIALTLSAQEEEALPLVRGRVELLGAGPQGHGGVVVELQGTPFSTVSRADGTFEVVSVPGPATLLLTRDRYVPLTVGPLNVGPDGLALEETLQMLGEPGRLRGVVQLPPGFAAEAVTDVAVRVERPGAGGDALVSLVAPAADGLFVADALPAADYVVRLSLAGFVPLSLPASVEAGTTRDLGALLLQAAPATAGVTGQARLQGIVDNANGHGGIRVEAVGTPFTTLTAGDGSFRLEVAPRPLTLAFRRESYGTQTAVLPAPPAGVDTALPNVVVLSALPGRIHGTASLARFGTVDRLRAAQISVLDARGAPVAQANPAADGQFVLPDIAHGDYTVRVAATGYETVNLGVTVPVGGLVELGHVSLVHKSEGPSAVVFAGQLTLGGASDHGGTVVRLRTADPDLAFAVANTDADGRFEVLAAPDEAYRVSAHHPGYDDPALDTAWRWDAGAQRRFEDEGGNPLALTLVPSPLDGRVEVSVRIAPDWIPVEQRHVSVRLRGTAFDQSQPQVGAAAPAVFTGVPAGTFALLIERPGFTSVQIPVTLDLARPAAVLGPVDVSLVNLAAAQIDLSGRQLDACALRRAPVSFRGADLSGARFTGDFSAAGGNACGGCRICGAFDLTGTNLTNADFTGATSLAGVDFDTAVLFGARAAGRNLEGASLNNANLFGADLAGARLGRADLRNANLTSAALGGAIFVAQGESQPTVPCGAGARPSVQLAGANFSQADLTAADLRGVNFTDASLGDASLQRALLGRACLRNANLTLINLAQANFDAADATGAQLTGAILDHTSMRGAELAGAVMTNAVFQDADLRPRPPAPNQAPNPYPWEGAQSDDVVCVGNVRWTDPRCARTQLDGANLNGANLVGARMDGVDLRGASLLGITLGDSDEAPDTQPIDCEPERYSACLDACAVINECEMNTTNGVAVALDCEQWLGQCMRGVFDIGTDRFSLGRTHPFATCLADAFVAAGCEEFNDGAGICGQAVSPYPHRPEPCTWARIQAGTCEAARVPPTCLTRATSLADARLDQAQMTAITLSRVHLTDAQVRNAHVRGAFVVDVMFRGADLQGSDLGRSELANAELDGVNLTGVNLLQSNLAYSNLAETTLTGAVLDDADLRQSLFIGATAVAPDERNPRASARRANLERADLTDAVLPGINLREANLSDARLRNTHLRGADLTAATLSPEGNSCVDLSAANLGDLQWPDAEVDYFDFSGARIAGVSVDGARFTSTRFNGADIVSSSFADTSFFGTCTPPAGYSPLDDMACTRDGADPSENCTTFAGATLEGVDLTNTHFVANLSDATVIYSDFDDDGGRDGAFRALAQRTAFDNLTIGFQSPFVPAAGVYYDANDADFSDACFVDTGFRYADLTDAVFDGSVTPRPGGNPVCQRACVNAAGDTSDYCVNRSAQCAAGTQTCLTFANPRLTRVVFRDAALSPVRFDNPTGSAVQILTSDLSRITMNTPTLTSVTATGSTFNNGVFQGGEIENSTFTNCNFRSARINAVGLSGTSFAGGDFNGATFAACNFGGNFTSNGARRTDFTNATFRDAATGNRADLDGADFINAILRNANLTQAWLRGTTFDGPAQRVDMTGAILNTANVNGALFRNVDLIGADVRACNFQAATWNNVNFTNATMCLADYNWIIGNPGVRCPGCNLTNVNRPACALVCNASDPCADF